MKLTPAQLRNIIREEVKKATSNKTHLSEAMTRITEDEIAAWKNGDWGYVSGDEQSQDDVHTDVDKALEPLGLKLGPKVDMHDEDMDPNRFLHGEDQHDEEGSMVKSKLYSMKDMAGDVCGVLNPDDQLPGWVQDHISVAHENIQQVHGYLMGKQHSMEREHGVMESKAKKTLSEAHNRVTREEMNAWMRGDWGFVSESHEEKLYDSDADWVNAIYDDNRTIDELLTAYHEMSDKGTTFGHEGDILNDYLNVGVNDVNDPSLPAELKVRVVQLIIELQDLAGIEKEQDVEQEKPEDIKTILRKKGIPAY